MNEHMNNNDGGLAMPPEELFDLLADRAAFGLEGEEDARLEELLREHAWVREDCLDEVAAALATDLDAADEPVPGDVMARIQKGVHAAIDAEPSPEVAGRITEPVAAPAPSGLGWLGWVAAAAAIGVAFVLARPDAGALVPTSEAELTTWIDGRPNAIRWDWAPGLVEPDEDATGMVTFDPDSQEGYMLIKGLEPNDPRFEQYQLWIWDQEREPDPANPAPLADNVHPVDGGVFDVNSEGEAVIPITAKLVVDTPYLFAVTVERPGGVAKSEKLRVPIIAGPPSDS